MKFIARGNGMTLTEKYVLITLFVLAAFFAVIGALCMITYAFYPTGGPQ